MSSYGCWPDNPASAISSGGNSLAFNGPAGGGTDLGLSGSLPAGAGGLSGTGIAGNPIQQIEEMFNNGSFCTGMAAALLAGTLC
jgi:hypothetical protein